jgi:hypothetical protein
MIVAVPPLPVLAAVSIPHQRLRCQEPRYRFPRGRIQSRSSVPSVATLPIRSSPAIWFCPAGWTRRQTGITARWAAGCWTTVAVVVWIGVMDRSTARYGATMLGCGQRCEGGAENNCSGKHDCRLTEHSRFSLLVHCNHADADRPPPSRSEREASKRHFPEALGAWSFRCLELEVIINTYGR